VLTTNRNLLIIADVLVLHRGFAEQHPKVVEGLVQGLLEGNRMVRDRPDAHLDVIGRAFKWTRDRHAGRAQERALVEPSGEPRVLLGSD
jgi:NitT/TauT family transport system substrate-binding protein